MSDSDGGGLTNLNLSTSEASDVELELNEVPKNLKSNERGDETEKVETQAGLFPVDFAIENVNFNENVFDEIELRSPEQQAAKVQIDQEDLTSLENIPKKMAFKIGEVAEMVGVKQYVLRYWESEFEQLSPKKSKFNQRVYTRKDVENALLIKKLLYKDRFSIEGARSAMKQLKEHVKEERALKYVNQNQEQVINLVEDLMSQIRKMKQQLQN